MAAGVELPRGGWSLVRARSDGEVGVIVDEWPDERDSDGVTTWDFPGVDGVPLKPSADGVSGLLGWPIWI